jgi:hypothetical protein
VNLDDQVPVIIFHILETDVPQNASIVDQDVNPAKRIDSSLNYVLAVLDTIVVRDCLTTRISDLVDNDIGGLTEPVTCQFPLHIFETGV